MQLQALNAISPVDGRYRSQLEHLSKYFSEYALIKYRLKIEADYFIALSEVQLFSLDESAKSSLLNIVDNFSIADAEKIKATEKITNHDVKAVEYFLKEKLAEAGNANLQEWVHFGLTSQDINNTAFPLLWKNALQEEYTPVLESLVAQLLTLANTWKNIPMLARTHGQPASPTTLGKEFMVFVERLHNQLDQLKSIPFSGKFGGATGNFNAHVVAFPGKNWIQFANTFLKEKLGLERQQYTTQIEHYDMLAAQFDAIKRINTILMDLCRDVWTYISMDYFKQTIKKDEVGSSAMPHKVNPIDFENAEGNLGLANALFEHLSAKLPISRLQRDLTDSTVLRNIGMPVAHTILAFKSIEKGLSKVILNEEKLAKDLDDNWAVVSEAIQTILRRENYPKPYEALKALARGGNGINHSTIYDFINSLQVPDNIKSELRNITPHNYVGYKLPN